MPSNDPACPVTDDEAERLWPVVAALLRTAPEVWETLDRNRLTAMQDRGLGLLTAAGLVERRSARRWVIPGSPAVVDATFTFTGDGGFEEALEPVAVELWRVWTDHLAAGEYRGGKPLRSEPIGPTEWRLTDSGTLAKGDLDEEGRAAGTFDWIMRRGLFDGRRRVTIDRQVVHLEHVAGHGRVERLIVRNGGQELSNVHVANHADIGESVAKAVAPLVEAVKEAAALPDRADAKPVVEHSDDFTSVVWYGTPYYFSRGLQADSVRALWAEWEKADGLGLHAGAILETLDASIDRDRFRLPNVFRDHPAWGTMIVSVAKGTYKLAAPPERAEQQRKRPRRRINAKSTRKRR